MKVITSRNRFVRTMGRLGLLNDEVQRLWH
jgi:hypothetical protein